MSQLHVQILHFTLHAQEKSSLNVDFLKKKMTTGLKEVSFLHKETWTQPCDSWC